ncbi:MAG: proline dehydrogenase family protein [Candidatus Zixiibacteriota bacterium]
MDMREAAVTVMPKAAIRLFSGPYVAGDSLEAAIAKAKELSDQKIASTVDVLGEDAASTQDISEYIALYERLIDALTSNESFRKLPEPLRPSVSLKPSSFVIAPKDDDGMIIDPSRVDWQSCEAALETVVDYGAAQGVRMTIDMENHQWTDFTLDVYRQLFKKHRATVGTVLQSRLFRTKDDVEQLPDGSRIRLCIGIYNEPETIAVQDMNEMKNRMIPLARRMFEKNIYVEFATHEIWLINRFFSELVVPLQITPDRFETQTLLGVPRQKLIRQLVTGKYFANMPGVNGNAAALNQGIIHRLYVPFAEDWNKAIAYCRRRLMHSPNLFWTGFVNAPRVLYHSIFSR